MPSCVTAPCGITRRGGGGNLDGELLLERVTGWLGPSRAWRGVSVVFLVPSLCSLSSWYVSSEYDKSSSIVSGKKLPVFPHHELYASSLLFPPNHISGYHCHHQSAVVNHASDVLPRREWQEGLHSQGKVVSSNHDVNLHPCHTMKVPQSPFCPLPYHNINR